MRLVLDASVAIKWFVPEEGSNEARRLENHFDLIAPDLVFAECANILWKMVRRGETSPAEAASVVDALTRLGLQIFPLGELATAATDLAIFLDHPAYDCFYLALAIAQDCQMMTADQTLLRIVRQRGSSSLLDYCVPLQNFNS